MEKTITFPDVLELNVGGIYYTTSLTTLTKGGSHMLAAMFSGRHRVAQDKDGRYFIDADGALFSHIIRYLRSGDLPCGKIAPEVYREAKYFGLEEFARHIERLPSMMSQQARLQFQAGLDGFDEAVDNILQVASKKQGIISDEVVSYAVIAILREPQNVMNPSFDNNHQCYVSLPLETITADLYIGPWDERAHDTLDITDRVYLRAIARELEARGFTVTFSKHGVCSYHVYSPDRLECKKALFKFIFHWHKHSFQIGLP